MSLDFALSCQAIVENLSKWSKKMTRRTEGSENQKQTVMQIQGLAQFRQQPGALVFEPGTVGVDTVPMHWSEVRTSSSCSLLISPRHQMLVRGNSYFLCLKDGHLTSGTFFRKHLSVEGGKLLMRKSVWMEIWLIFLTLRWAFAMSKKLLLVFESVCLKGFLDTHWSSFLTDCVRDSDSSEQARCPRTPFDWSDSNRQHKTGQPLAKLRLGGRFDASRPSPKMWWAKRVYLFPRLIGFCGSSIQNPTGTPVGDGIFFRNEGLKLVQIFWNRTISGLIGFSPIF